MANPSYLIGLGRADAAGRTNCDRERAEWALLMLTKHYCKEI
ncbi:MAG TPA: hypothetical protein VF717_11685 [Pyrinomonadaceae bacterium]|jgi:hypothetical protein